MRVEIELQSLHALHSGERTAEPYLWPLFFRLDEQAWSEGIRGAVAAGELADHDLAARGLDWPTIEARSHESDWFDAPGGPHGNLPRMSTGETAQIDHRFDGELVGGAGIIAPTDAVVGCVLILWEEDHYPGHAKVKKAYSSFADATRTRLLRAVRDAIRTQKGGEGPFRFGLGPTLDPRALERELTQRYQKRWAVPLMDCDDFIGATFWAATVGDLQASGTQECKKLWTPTTGSQEGSWEIRFTAGLGS